jgi:hypothetical protein
MADDPWDAFPTKPPAQSAPSTDDGADPWAQFPDKPGGKKPAPSGATSLLGGLLTVDTRDAIWNKPKDVGISDWILRHIAKAVQQPIDVGHVALGDLPGAGYVMDPESTAAAQKRLQGTALSGSGEALSTVAPGVAGEALGAGRMIAGAVEPGIASVTGARVAPWIARGIGGAAEQAPFGVAGALAQGQDPIQAGLISGAIGAVTGPFGRAGPITTAARDAGPTAAELTAATERAYKPMDETVADRPDFYPPIKTAWDKLRTSTGDLSATQKAATSVKAVVDDIRSNKEMTFGELDKMSQRLGKASTRGTLEDQALAPGLKKVIDDFIETGTGGNPATGIMTAPGEMGAARAAARIAHGREEDAKWLAQAQIDASLPGGPGVGRQAQQRLLTEEGQRFAPAGTPQRDAMTALANMPGSAGSLGPSTFDLHRIAAPLIGGAIGGLSGGHEDLGTMLQRAAEGAAIGYAAKGAKYISPAMLDRAATQAAARNTLTTGAPFRPVTPSGKIGDILRTLSAAYGARGGF